MDSVESLKAGKLDECLASLQAQVRSQPDKAELRVFLFQLLAVLGRWDRALNQLNVAAQLDALAIPMAQTYRGAIQGELLRTEIFAGTRSPLVFGQPERWMALLIDALRLDATGESGRAAELRDEAFAEAPATSGTVDGSAFEWIADADAALGPMLEAMVNGRYYWIPMHRIRTLKFEPPVDLRDRVWTAASFTWANGGEAVGLIPTRYPATLASSDSALLLSRRTDWIESADGSAHGLGQRMFATDAGEHALLDFRVLELASTAESETPAEAAPIG